MAGESAQERARRQRERAGGLTRSAEMWEKGAEGERRTADALATLPADSWTVFHDLKWPGRKFANVDHIVVGPPGVFVIDSKNWSGSIGVVGSVLMQNGRPREQAVAGAADAALAISQLSSLVPPDLVKPVLCFTREVQLTGWARDVIVTSTSTLVPMLTSRPVLLSAEEVRHLSLDLDGGLRSAMAQPTRARSIPRTAPRVWSTPSSAAALSTVRQPPPQAGPSRSVAAPVLAIFATLMLLSSPSLLLVAVVVVTLVAVHRRGR